MKDSAGLSVSNPINGKQIIINKTIGIIKAIDFNIYPDQIVILDYDNDLINLDNSVINDFQVDDVFHDKIYFYGTNNQTHGAHVIGRYHIEEKRKIKSKSVTTLKIIYTVEYKKVAVYSRTDRNDYTTVDSGITTISFPNNTYGLPALPFVCIGQDIVTRVWTEQRVKGSIHNRPEKMLRLYSCSSHGYSDKYRIYTKGLGKTKQEMFSTRDDLLGIEWYELRYYQKGNETWGDPLAFDRAMDSVLNLGTQNIKKVELKIYPNPVYDQLSISFDQAINEEMNLQLINALGKVVHEEKINAVAEKTIPFDYPAGLYYIRLSGDQGIITDKIIKIN